MTPRHFSPNNSNFASSDSSLSLFINNLKIIQLNGENLYPVDICNAFAEIEFSVFDGVATFDFDEGDTRGCIAFSAGV